MFMQEISGMTHETLKWKLFPFSLSGEAKQWYIRVVGCVNGNWIELRDRICSAFFPLSRICALRMEILTFRQNDKESIGVAWARFTLLVKSGETSELLATEKPSRPPIELKPLPSGLRYAFLNSDVESPVIISDKLSEEEMNKLITVLEKHRSF